MQLYDGALQQDAPAEDFAPDFDLGVNYQVMRDDQMPDDCYPVLRRGGNMFRSPLHLPVLPPPRKSDEERSPTCPLHGPPSGVQLGRSAASSPSLCSRTRAVAQRTSARTGRCSSRTTTAR